MDEPEKPFACTVTDCGMTFTNEDHLNVHLKKHDMVLQLGLEQRTAFVADQTPTPTRFIRNCEEVGLFQDLTVNPFDEGFKRAMETKSGVLSLEAIAGTTSDDVLHTPQMVYPTIDAADSALFSSTNNQRNITISRSSSDESGAVKEYETTTISKLTNEVTTISRIVGKQDVHDKTAADNASNTNQDGTVQNKDIVNETSVSYTNNVIQIKSNVEIRKDGSFLNIDSSKNVPVTLISYTDSVIKDATSLVTSKDLHSNDNNKLQVPPIMSQKSLDYVVDSLVTECPEARDAQEKDNDLVKMMKKRNIENVFNNRKNDDTKNIRNTVKQKDTDKAAPKFNNDANNYEVIIKLPDGKCVRMKADEEITSGEEKSKLITDETKEKLKKVIINKKQSQTPVMQHVSGMNNPQIVQRIQPISTLYPVAIVTPITTSLLVTNNMQKIPLQPISSTKPNKRKLTIPEDTIRKKSCVRNKSEQTRQYASDSVKNYDGSVKIENNNNNKVTKSFRNSEELERRNASSRRYRHRLKETMKALSEENKQLKTENACLRLLFADHMKNCPKAGELKLAQKNIEQTTREK